MLGAVLGDIIGSHYQRHTAETIDFLLLPPMIISND